MVDHGDHITAPHRPPAPPRSATAPHSPSAPLIGDGSHAPEARRTRAPREKSDGEKALGALFCIGGFVLLFNGMFWLALICWFVLPRLILHNRRG